MESIMMNAEDVAAALLCSKTKAYQIIRECNKQLQKEGYIVLSGKVPRAFLLTRIYGGEAIGRQ